MLEFLPATLAAGQQLGVPRLSLHHAAFRPLRLIVDLGGGPANLLVGLGEQFGQRQFDVVGDPVHLGEPFGADLVEERSQTVFVEPERGFRQVSDFGQRVGRLGRGEVAQDGRFALDGFAPVGDLDGEHPFVDDVPEAIDDAGPIEVDADRHFMSEGEEASPLLEVLLRGMKCVPADRLEERVAWRNPFEVVSVRCPAMHG